MQLTKELKHKIRGLSGRAKNVIKKIGGIDELLNYYNTHQSLSDLRNCGKKTELELTEFLEDNFSEPEPNNELLLDSNVDVMDFIFDFYTKKKNEYDSYLVDFFNYAESLCQLSNGNINKPLFLDIVFFNPQKKVVKKIKKVTKLRLYDVLREEIVTIYNNNVNVANH